VRLEFVKMSGAGNDFIVVDNRDGSLEGILSAPFIASICKRGIAVGADGLLELREDHATAFRMKYYNSDGSAAEMCGNGGRCIVVYACSKGLVEPGAAFEFMSDAGVHRGMVTGMEESRIWMTPPVVHFLDREMEVGNTTVRVSLVDTGVPHAVVITEGPDSPPFLSVAPALRNHPSLGESGANADYLWTGDGGFSMRTWERGVEGETLACGTGAVACALCAGKLLGARMPVGIEVKSGRTLTVGNDDHGWWLQGEAREVYRGILEHPSPKSLTEEG